MGLFQSKKSVSVPVVQDPDPEPIQNDAEEEQAAVNAVVEGLVAGANEAVIDGSPEDPMPGSSNGGSSPEDPMPGSSNGDSSPEDPMPGSSNGDGPLIENAGEQGEGESQRIPDDNVQIPAGADCNENDVVANVSGCMAVENGEDVPVEPIADDIEQSQDNEVADQLDGALASDDPTVKAGIKRSADEDEEEAQESAETPRKKSNIEEQAENEPDELEGPIVESNNNNASEDDEDENGMFLAS